MTRPAPVRTRARRSWAGLAQVWPFVIVALVCAVVASEAAWVRRNASVTVDETFYLSCGLQTIRDGQLDSRLAKAGVAPLPILLTHLTSLARTAGDDRPDPWSGQPEDRELVRGPRTANLMLHGIPLVLLVFGWVYCRRGPTAATFAAGLLGLSPTILAHASLATTDMGFAFFATGAVATLGWYMQRPSAARLVVLALVVSAAMASKYSGLFLLPVVFLVVGIAEPMCADGISGVRRSARSSVATLLVFGLFVCVFWWALHLFSFSGPLKSVPTEATPESSPWVRILGRGPMATWIMDQAYHGGIGVPSPVTGVLMQHLHNSNGHPAFLNGEHSRTGWWSYFPYAFAYKATPAELLLFLGIVAGGMASLRRPVSALRAADPGLRAILIAVAVFTAMMLTSRINIGQRYLLFLYPMLIIAGTDRLFASPSRQRAASVAGAGLLMLQVISNISSAPHFLAYFNAVSGGPELGWTRLVDSNIDWGQDLPALRKALAQRSGGGGVALSYFGTAVPESYGVTADSMYDLAYSPEHYGSLAVSVSHLQGIGIWSENGHPARIFRAFRHIAPDARAGYSILVFDLDSAEKRHAFKEAVAAAEHARTRARADGSRHHTDGTP